MQQIGSANRLEARSSWAFGLILAGCSVYALVLAAKIAHYPLQFDYEEGNILNAGLRITHGLTPYPDPHGWPIVLNPYGPVAYLFIAGLIKIFGLSFFAPRLESIVCGGIIAVLVHILLRRSGAGWPTSIGFAAMFLCNNSARSWILSCRVDWLGLALSLGGLTILFCFPKRWFPAVVLLVAALFVKVSLLAAPAACGVYLIAQRDWRRLWKCLVAGLLLGVLGFAVTEWWSSGYFWFHQLKTHPDAYRLGVYFLFLGLVARAFPMLAGLSLLAVAASIRQKQFPLPVLYFLMSALGAATIGKAGSNTNHLLELYAALAWCAGYGWEFAARWFKERNFSLAGTATLVGVYLAILIPFSLYRAPIDDPSQCNRIYDFLRTHGNVVLTDNVGALLLSGKPVSVSNPYVFAQLALHAGWSDAPIRDRIVAKKFDVILLERFAGQYGGPDARFTPETIRAIKQNYHVAAEFECLDATVAYVPD